MTQNHGEAMTKLERLGQAIGVGTLDLDLNLSKNKELQG